MDIVKAIELSIFILIFVVGIAIVIIQAIEIHKHNKEFEERRIAAVIYLRQLQEQEGKEDGLEV